MPIAASRRETDDRRGSSSSRGYGYAWQKARDQFLRENPLCAEDLKAGRSVPAALVDHIVAPRLKEARASGDPEQISKAQALFWSRKNWQPLCKFCHDSVKQRLEKSGRVVGCTPEGLPLDPKHPWARSMARTQGEGGDFVFIIFDQDRTLPSVRKMREKREGWPITSASAN